MYTHEQIFQKLISVDSSTNSAAEVWMAEEIDKMIKEQPYFQKRRELCGLYEIQGDSLKRSIPWGLYLAKKKESSTIVLTGHSDTVSIENYGTLKTYALMPDTLREMMKSEELPKDVRNDLESDEWIFGRGTADMKGGLSALIHQLFKACEENSLPINLLFIAVPDEETYSVGMRNAVPLMVRLQQQYGLDYRMMVMSESHLREDQKALYFDGTIGKTQVNMVVKGVPVHTRFYYTGINPMKIAAQIMIDIDGSSDMTEQYLEEKTPPPSVMYCRDTKESYDVTLPECVDMAMSFLTYRKTGKELLDELKERIEKSIDKILSQNRVQYQDWAATLSAPVKPCEQKPQVLFYEDLLKLAYRKNPTEFDEYENALKSELSLQKRKGLINFNDASLKLIHKIMDYLNQDEPMVVLAITPPLYPGFTNKDIAEHDTLAINMPEKLCKYSKEELGQEARFEHFFAGIADMSYAATTYKPIERSFIDKNMPMWGEDYSIDFDGIAKIQMPVLNVGPWGKNIHTKYERVNKYSLFQECPTLLHWIIQEFSKDL